MKSGKERLMRKEILRNAFRIGWIPLLILYCSVLTSSFLSAIAPLVMGDSINSILGTAGEVVLTFSKLRLLLLIGTGALLIQFVGSILRKVFYKSFLLEWIPRMCEKLYKIELGRVEKYESGYLSRRLSTELKSIPAYLSSDIPGLIDSAIVLLISLYMLISLFPKVSIALVIASVVLIPIGIPIVRKLKSYYAETLEHWSRLEGVTTYYSSSQLQLRSFRAYDRIINKIRDRVRVAASTDMLNTLKGHLLMSGLYVLVVGGLIGFLVYAENTPEIATANAGSIVSFLGYLFLFAGRANGVTSSIGKMQNSRATLDRMVEFLCTPDYSIDSDKQSICGIETISVRNLAASIEGEVIFSNCSFEVEHGDIVAIKGRSGCGKSTLLKTLFGVLPRAAGDIIVNGKPVSGLAALGSKAVLLPQEIKFFSGSLRNNLEVLSGVDITDRMMEKLLTEVHLESRIDPDTGDDENLNEGGANLSGGEKQRLALGAALLRRPFIALLDEPTSQLDDFTEGVILEMVKNLASDGAIVFCVAHKPSVFRLADKVIDMDAL